MTAQWLWTNKVATPSVKYGNPPIATANKLGRPAGAIISRPAPRNWIIALGKYCVDHLQILPQQTGSRMSLLLLPHFRPYTMILTTALTPQLQTRQFPRYRNKL